MSMHKIPLTQIEEEGLRSHGLARGTPSQLSDVFRQGMAWAQRVATEEAAVADAVRAYIQAGKRGEDLLGAMTHAIRAAVREKP